MNRKINTVVFLVAATLFNIVVTVVSFIAMIVLYGRLIAPSLPPGAAAWGLPVVFIASIAVAFVAYRGAVKVLLSRMKAEDFFNPFSSRRKGTD